jgi:hypothetical protein
MAKRQSEVYYRTKSEESQRSIAWRTGGDRRVTLNSRDQEMSGASHGRFGALSGRQSLSDRPASSPARKGRPKPLANAEGMRDKPAAPPARPDKPARSEAAATAAKIAAGAGRGLRTTWAFIRGPGWTATWKAINQTEAFLIHAEHWIVETLRRKPPPEPEPPPRELHPRLQFTDLDIDDPEDALHALRRAARVPPHLRRMDQRDGRV